MESVYFEWRWYLRYRKKGSDRWSEEFSKRVNKLIERWNSLSNPERTQFLQHKYAFFHLLSMHIFDIGSTDIEGRIMLDNQRDYLSLYNKEARFGDVEYELSHKEFWQIFQKACDKCPDLSQNEIEQSMIESFNKPLDEQYLFWDVGKIRSFSFHLITELSSRGLQSFYPVCGYCGNKIDLDHNVIDPDHFDTVVYGEDSYCEKCDLHFCSDECRYDNHSCEG